MYEDHYACARASRWTRTGAEAGAATPRPEAEPATPTQPSPKGEAPGAGQYRSER